MQVIQQVFTNNSKSLQQQKVSTMTKSFYKLGQFPPQAYKKWFTTEVTVESRSVGKTEDKFLVSGTQVMILHTQQD